MKSRLEGASLSDSMRFQDHSLHPVCVRPWRRTQAAESKEARSCRGTQFRIAEQP